MGPILSGKGITTYAPWNKEDYPSRQLHLFYPGMKGNVFYILWNGKFITLDGRLV